MRTFSRNITQRLESAEQIRKDLKLRGWSFLAVDRHCKLERGTAQTTLREPNAAGEMAIARLLQTGPGELWPERYDLKTGERHSPQPAANYERLPTISQLRKAQEALT